MRQLITKETIVEVLKEGLSGEKKSIRVGKSSERGSRESRQRRRKEHSIAITNMRGEQRTGEDMREVREGGRTTARSG